MAIRTTIERLITEEGGQDLAEYGIALAVVALGAGIAAVAVATNVNQLWSRASDAIGQVV